MESTIITSYKVTNNKDTVFNFWHDYSQVKVCFSTL
jgi:hypothetical protein